jgi:hypothetical protein
MGDLRDTRLMYAKAGLFVLGGLAASTLVLLECPSLRVAALLTVAIWCFARAYYFAFYVIERYIDPGYRFSGLWSLGRYLLRRKPREESRDISR